MGHWEQLGGILVREDVREWVTDDLRVREGWEVILGSHKQQQRGVHSDPALSEAS